MQILEANIDHPTTALTARFVLASSWVLIVCGLFEILLDVMIVSGAQFYFPSFEGARYSDGFASLITGSSILLFGQSKKVDALSRGLAVGLIIMTALLGLGAAAQYYPESFIKKMAFLGGYMSAFAAVSFLLLGASILMLRKRFCAVLAHVLTLCIMALSVLSITGYFYGTVMQYGVQDHSPLAFHIAVLLLVASLAVFLLRPDFGLARMVAGNSLGGWVFRRLAPVALGMPFIIGWLQIFGERTVLFDSIFRIAIMMLTLMLILTAALWIAAVALDKIDQARRETQAMLSQSDEKYKLLVDHATAAVASHKMVFNESGQPVDYIFLSANKAFERQTGLNAEDIIGKPVSQILPGIERSHIMDIYGHIVLSG